MCFLERKIWPNPNALRVWPNLKELRVNLLNGRHKCRPLQIKNVQKKITFPILRKMHPSYWLVTWLVIRTSLVRIDPSRKSHEKRKFFYDKFHRFGRMLSTIIRLIVVADGFVKQSAGFLTPAIWFIRQRVFLIFARKRKIIRCQVHLLEFLGPWRRG